jgi:hypothetical protein
MVIGPELTSSPILNRDSTKASPTIPILNDERPSGPIFPIEIISKIITCLQHDRKYATLASMALSNSTFNNLVIPKLYETITITKTNMLKLRYGHETRIMKHSPRSLQPDGVCHDDTDCPSSAETYRSRYGTDQPRKDWAVRHCLRLIFDIPINMVDTIKNLACRLPCQPYGRVEEIVFTSQRISYCFHAWAKETVVLPPLGWPSRMDKGLLKPRRVVIYTPIDRRLSYQLGCLQMLRRQARLVLHLDHRYSATTPRRDLAFTTLDVHFTQPLANDYPCVDSHLAAWLVHDHDARTTEDRSERIQLFDIPSLIINDQDRPERQDDATELARLILSRHVHEQVTRKGHVIPGRTKAIMDRIEFKNSEDGEDEYPVLKPRPVSYTSPNTCHVMKADHVGTEATR